MSPRGLICELNLPTRRAGISPSLLHFKRKKKNPTNNPKTLNPIFPPPPRPREVPVPCGAHATPGSAQAAERIADSLTGSAAKDLNRVAARGVGMLMRCDSRPAHLPERRRSGRRPARHPGAGARVAAGFSAAPGWGAPTQGGLRAEGGEGGGWGNPSPSPERPLTSWEGGLIPHQSHGKSHVWPQSPPPAACPILKGSFSQR